MNDDYKITVDWFGIKEKYAEAGIDISDMLMPYDESLAIKCDSRCYDSICTASASAWEYEHESEMKELKQKLEEAAEDLARRDGKIKELEAEVVELNAMIEYCKKNGIWAEKA